MKRKTKKIENGSLFWIVAIDLSGDIVFPDDLFSFYLWILIEFGTWTGKKKKRE